MAELAIMDYTGDTKIIWDPNKPDEVEHARETFTKFTRDKKYAAFRVKKGGAQGEQIKTFDAAAEAMILVPPLVGG